MKKQNVKEKAKTKNKTVSANKVNYFAGQAKVVMVDCSTFKVKSTLDDLRELAEQSTYGATGEGSFLVDINCNNINMKKHRNKEVVEIYKQASKNSVGFVVHVD